MHGLAQKRIIERKRKEREAKRAARLAAEQPAVQLRSPRPPTPDPIAEAWEATKHELPVLMQRFLDLGGERMLYRVTRLREIYDRDQANRTWSKTKSVKNPNTGVYMTTTTYRPYNEWTKPDADFLRHFLGPDKPLVQKTRVEDIKRWVKSPAKKGSTPANPKFDWKPLFFGGGGGVGPARAVMSIIHIVDPSTPQDIYAWLQKILPKLESGELLRQIADIESRHGTLQARKNIVQGRNAAMDRKARLKRAQPGAYRRVKQKIRWDKRSNVGDMRRIRSTF